MRSCWSRVWYSVFVMSKIKESFTLHIETLWDFISKYASNMPVFSHDTGRAYAGRMDELYLNSKNSSTNACLLSVIRW